MLGGQSDGAIGQPSGGLEIASDQRAEGSPVKRPAQGPDLRLRFRQAEGLLKTLFRPGMVTSPRSRKHARHWDVNAYVQTGKLKRCVMLIGPVVPRGLGGRTLQCSKPARILVQVGEHH